MRATLIVGGIVILNMAAWAPCVHAQAGGGHGAGASHGAFGHGGLENRMNLGVFHSEYINKPIEIPLGPEFVPFPGQPPIGPVAPGQIPGGMVVGGPDHLILGNLSGHIDDSHTQSHAHGHGHAHVHPHVGGGAEHGESQVAQGTAANDGSNQAVATTIQAGLLASPAASQPPGARGPGQPLSGLIGPGRPGPGSPLIPRW